MIRSMVLAEHQVRTADMFAGRNHRRYFAPLMSLLILGPICAASAQAPPATPEGVTVDRVEFVGNTVLGSDLLRETAGIRPGEVTTSADLVDAARRIETTYAEGGYLATVTSYDVSGAPPLRILTFSIREARIAEIRITGLRRTREQTVRRVMETEPGDIYSRRAVQRDVERLSALGTFEVVNAYVEDSEIPGALVLTVEVKEARTRRIDVGGSFSPEGRLIAQVEYTDINFFGRAQQLRAAVNVGSIEAEIGGQVAYLNPFVGPPGATLLARAYSDVLFRFSRDLVNEPGVGRYFERRTGVQGLLSRPAGRAHRLTYGLRYDNASVENFPTEFFVPDIPSPEASFLLASLRLVEDRRLFLAIPASGSYLATFVEAGPVNREIGGTDGIAKASFDHRLYVPLRRITPEMLDAETLVPIRTLAFRLDAGTSVGDLPFYEQYFVGGITDLRGYREGRFWGRHFFLLNAELRWPLGGQFMGLAFVDVGDAWDSDFQFVDGVSTSFRQHRDFSPRMGAGVGVWWVTELGVVRLEFARGEENRVHFTVGETF